MLEQKSLYLDLDNKDQQALHFRGMQGDELIAYGRVSLDDIHKIADIKRVAIHPNFRKNQLGSLLMTTMLDFIQQQPNIKTVELDAQYHLQRFYEKYGFEAVHEPYDDGGVMHIKMTKKI